MTSPQLVESLSYARHLHREVLDIKSKGRAVLEVSLRMSLPGVGSQSRRASGRSVNHCRRESGSGLKAASGLKTHMLRISPHKAAARQGGFRSISTQSTRSFFQGTCPKPPGRKLPGQFAPSGKIWERGAPALPRGSVSPWSPRSPRLRHPFRPLGYPFLWSQEVPALRLQP